MASYATLALLALLVAAASPAASVVVTKTTVSRVPQGVAFRGGDAHLGGACGFQRPFPLNSTFVAGVSSKLFKLGQACGSCFQLQCIYSRVCRPGKTVTVVATNDCNGGKGKNATGPCTRGAFNLQPQAYDQIVKSKNAGPIYMRYKQVPCQFSGGVEFAVLSGNNYYLSVLVQNVGGAGNLKLVEVSVGGSAYKAMVLNYGAVWHIWQLPIANKPLSFRLTTRTGKVLIVNSAVPAQWTQGKIYATKTQLPAVL